MPNDNRRTYPRFSPVRIENHSILGVMKIYEFDRFPKNNGEGMQTSFFTNNAEVDNENQYAIKIFNTSIEAYAAYQRQALAAEEGLAPPVGVMVRWIVRVPSTGRRVNRWGYETCRAACDAKSQRVAGLLASPNMYDYFRQFCTDRGYSINPWNSRSLNAFRQHIDYRYNEGITQTDTFSMIERDGAENSLKNRLSRIDITGTQYDDLSEAYGDIEAWRSNDRLTLGAVYYSKDGAYMSGDLHAYNVGLWRGNAVVIDFGYHLASPAFKYEE